MAYTDRTIQNYMDKSDLEKFIEGNSFAEYDIKNYKKMALSGISGIEGMPYQFLPTVDRRIDGKATTNSGSLGVCGRKYLEKIYNRMPLLFISPCSPVFMDQFKDSERKNVFDMLSTGANLDISELISEPGRYYTIKNDYETYLKYLNTMLTAVAVYLDLYNQPIYLSNSKRDKNSNSGMVKLGEVNWGDELNEDFKTFFSAQENLIFYLDSFDSVSESYSNGTTESSLASQINGFADQANEIRFLFGDEGSAVADMISKGSEVATSISQAISGAANAIGGGIVGSLAEKGVNTVLNGGKIVFPEIWSNSSYEHSYSINIKLRSPDNDNLSIFLNVLKPYCKLLALVLPRIQVNNGVYNANAYNKPFLVKAYSKGMFSIDMGLITSMSVNKGGTGAWNDDGLPTQLDISIDIADLYKSLAMSSGVPESENIIESTLGSINPFLSADNSRANLVANTSYMDFLANISGLNIGQMIIGRRVQMYYYMTKANVKRVPSAIHTHFDQALTNAVGWLYNRTS